MNQELFHEDCLEYLKRAPDAAFSAACFSPPYGVGGTVFDVRKDFKKGGAFMPYVLELSRTCDVWAINLTQKVHATRNYPYIEELTMALEAEGVELFDRWVIIKPTSMPARGERPLTRFEFVLLYSRSEVRPALRKRAEGSTVLDVRSHAPTVWGKGNNQLTPYFAEIPRQVFSMYGGPKPVLDPFAGTSLAEAKALGLSFVGVEKRLAVYEDLCKRMGVGQ